MEVLVMMVLLIAAVFFDVRDRKIPNVLILAGWGMALLFCMVRGDDEEFVRCIVSVVGTILCAFPLFKLHVIGAGDIKLLSVIGSLHGLGFLWQVILVWLTLAGAVSVVVMFRRQLVRERFLHLKNYMLLGRVCKEVYYDRERDGTACTIALAPILALAYVLVQIGRWKGIC